MTYQKLCMAIALAMFGCEQARQIDDNDVGETLTDSPNMAVDVNVDGFEGVACPTAIIQVERDTLTAGESLNLNGGQSHSLNGAIARYEWSITSASGAIIDGDFRPSKYSAGTAVALNHPGIYEVGLAVYDVTDTVSCHADVLRIEVTPISGY